MPLSTDPNFAPAPAAVTAALTSAAPTSGAFTPQVGRPVSLTITGTWDGTIKVQKRRDSGAWSDMTLFGAATLVFSGNCDEVIDESNWPATDYQVVRVNATSGTANIRIGH